MPRHFLEISDLSRDEVAGVLREAHRLRAVRDDADRPRPLARRTLAMLFEKPSLRTRVSFEQGMTELGGNAIVLGQAEVGLGQREAVGDVGRVLGGMVHGIAARVFEHAHLEELAGSAGVPVINMLSDRHHPAQALADVLTLMDAFSPGEPEGLTGRKVAYVGDGDNNVARSLCDACGVLGIGFACAAPPGHQLEEGHGQRSVDPREVVAGADAVYADTFVSMGAEDEKAQRLETFGPYPARRSLARRRRARGDRVALPAGVPRRGDHRRRDGRPAVAGVRAGAQPAARAEGAAGVPAGLSPSAGPAAP